MSKINSFEWFEQIIGFREKKWNYQLDSIPIDILDSAGSFVTKSIKELKELADFTKKGNQKKLKIIMRTQKTKDNEQFFDTSELQYNAKEDTLFQVASNFNCMELGSETRSVYSGKYITQLMLDCTQGPSAAGGAVFGSILRVAKHKEKEINLLEDTPLKPNNGKLYNTSKYSNFDQDLVKVGIQTNVRANFCRSYFKFEYNPNNVKINQVYTSTCIISNKYDNYLELADILLEKAYEGTFLSGIISKTPKIVLTLIGGHTFQNPMNLIINKIIKIHEMYSQYLPSATEVILPIYQPNRTALTKYIILNHNVEIIWM